LDEIAVEHGRLLRPMIFVSVTERPENFLSFNQ